MTLHALTPKYEVNRNNNSVKRINSVKQYETAECFHISLVNVMSEESMRQKIVGRRHFCKINF